MKKFIALAVGFLALFGFAASAFAIHAEIPAESQAVVARGTIQLTISGDLRVRGWLEKNIGSGGAITDNQNQTYYDERVRLAVDASQGNVSGRIHLESGEDNNDVWRWGSYPDNLMGDISANRDFNAKPTTMNVLEAWIQYTGAGLGVPAGIKVGHMPLALGPDTLFFDHTKFGDDAIVGWVDPTPSTHIVALTIKAAEEDPASFGNISFLGDNAQDLDVYVALINQVLAGQNLQAYYVYANGPEAETSTGDIPGVGSLTVGPNIKIQDLGLNASGSFSGLTYKAEYDQQLGSSILGGAGNPKADFKGYALELDLGYKLGPAGIRLMGVVGSGPKSNSNNVDQFVNFLSSNQYSTVVYGYRVRNAMGQTNGSGTFGQWSNTEALNLGVDLNPTADLKVSLDAYLLRATEVSGLEQLLNVSSISHNVGSEYDLQANYALAKNLNYFVKAGALVGGSFYSDSGFGQKKTAMVAMHGLELSF